MKPPNKVPHKRAWTAMLMGKEMRYFRKPQVKEAISILCEVSPVTHLPHLPQSLIDPPPPVHARVCCHQRGATSCASRVAMPHAELWLPRGVRALPHHVEYFHLLWRRTCAVCRVCECTVFEHSLTRSLALAHLDLMCRVSHRSACRRSRPSPTA